MQGSKLEFNWDFFLRMGFDQFWRSTRCKIRQPGNIRENIWLHCRPVWKKAEYLIVFIGKWELCVPCLEFIHFDDFVSLKIYCVISLHKTDRKMDFDVESVYFPLCIYIFQLIVMRNYSPAIWTILSKISEKLARYCKSII